MQPPSTRNYEPPSREEIYAAHLDKAIAFHQNNQDDPHNIGNSVVCALLETRNALAKAYRIPAQNKCRSV